MGDLLLLLLLTHPQSSKESNFFDSAMESKDHSLVYNLDNVDDHVGKTWV
jgi:hypothetical protein